MSIYKIYNDDECYIGKTIIKYVYNRISKHKYLFKHNEKYQTSAKRIFEKGDWDWCILETNIDFDKLNEREKYYIENTTNCINVSNVYLTDEERKNHRNQHGRNYYYKVKGTEKDPNFNKQEYKAIWKLKKKWGEDWINHTKKYKK